MVNVDEAMLMMRRRVVRRNFGRGGGPLPFPNFYWLMYRACTVKDVLRIRTPRTGFSVFLKVPVGVPRRIQAMIREVAERRAFQVITIPTERADSTYQRLREKMRKQTRKYQATPWGRRLLSLRRSSEIARNRAWVDNMYSVRQVMDANVDEYDQRDVFACVRYAEIRAEDIPPDAERRELKVRGPDDLYRFRRGYGDAPPPKVFVVPRDVNNGVYIMTGFVVDRFLHAGLVRADP